MTMSAPTLEKILQAVNEKYGTSLEGWTQIPTAYEVGDTVPNWSAYEKIEMPKPFLWKIKLSGAPFKIFGKVQNNVLYCYGPSIERAFIVNDAGKIGGSEAVTEEYLTNNVKPKLDEIGISNTSVGYDTSTYSVNDNVENWDEYTLLQ